MNAFLLIIPMLVVRYAVPTLVGTQSDAGQRMAHVALPAAEGLTRERVSRVAYELFTLAVVLVPLALTVRAQGVLLWVGATLYLAGLAIDVRATADFCHPGPHGFCEGGLYRISRNPVYVGYLVLLLGVCCLAASVLMLGLTVGFQLAGHCLVLAEERWCRERFGEPYVSYMRRVRRYI